MTDILRQTSSVKAATTVEMDPTQPVVRLRNLVKRFRRGDGTVANAIDGVTLDVMPGEFVVLLGPSGCGKTTLLRTIAGLERADEGEIDIHGRTVFSATRNVELPPERRNLSMIFQSYALWPHLTVFDNVAYPLRNRRRGLSKAQIAERVDHVLGLVGVSELRKQYPGQMSGGQQQRVALARALVDGGDLVLFDEPLSNVDAKVRESLRRELLEMQRRLGFAAVYVTHDQSEAMELAHRVAVMGAGKVSQLGAPEDVYLRPTSRYVANFVGTTNEIPATVRSVDGGRLVVDTAAGQITGVAASDKLEIGGSAVASFRPEYCTIGGPNPDANVWPGIVESVLFLGPSTETVVRLGGTELRVRSVTLGHADHKVGEDVSVHVAAERMRVLPTEDAVGATE
jgi:iron(III) transport system ATP-binding protein